MSDWRKQVVVVRRWDVSQQQEVVTKEEVLHVIKNPGQAHSEDIVDALMKAVSGLEAELAEVKGKLNG